MDLEITRGDNEVLEITVLRKNSPVNLTGAKLWFTAKNNKEDSDDDAVIAKNTTDNGILVPYPLLGKASVGILPADTAELDKETTLYYDVQLRESTGIVSTVATGLLKVVLDVTDSTT